MGVKRILILTAVEVEARAVARALGLKRGAGPGTWRGNDEIDIELRAVGVRAVRLPQLRPATFDWVILTGLAGALDPTLVPGDLVLNGTPDGFRPRTPFRIGAIHTADAIVSTPAEKAALFAVTGALAVDMESAAVRPLAASTGARFADLRVVLDPFDAVLSPDLAGLVDPFGKPKPLALTKHLLRDPASIRTLTRLGCATRDALHVLGGAVADLVKHLRDLD